LATSAAFFGGLPAVFTVSVIEGGAMHHTINSTNSDRVDLADRLGFRSSEITYVAQKHYDAEILEER
jgi:hypothetical protein